MTSMATDAGFAAGAYQDAAVVASLAERGAIDPASVARWVDRFVLSAGPTLAPAIQAAVLSQLAEFQLLIRSIPDRPPAH